ncbi:MAG: hypothetical protein KDJ75_09430 [Alphaproteobacteria bacterium]|nr:hypothetical protein [Alphaproteobacteria bacterium]
MLVFVHSRYQKIRNQIEFTQTLVYGGIRFAAANCVPNGSGEDFNLKRPGYVMKILKFFLAALILVLAGGFVTLAFTDIRPVQEQVIQTIPAPQFADE